MKSEEMLLIKPGRIIDPAVNSGSASTGPGDRSREGKSRFSGEDELLTAGGSIAARAGDIDCRGLAGLEVIDASDKLVVPGFIDSHVHIAGGGGEDGFASRTPPLKLDQAIRGGVTTAVGCLGTDGTTRTMPDLLARARGLTEEGITAHIYTGSYQFPVRTLTGSIADDIIYVNEIIGLGEIAVADHRSSHPDLTEFIRAASEARRGGMLSGSKGVVNVHIGSGQAEPGFSFLQRAVKESEIPVDQFLPTHTNRSRQVFEQGLKFARRGGWLDFTASSSSSGEGAGGSGSGGDSAPEGPEILERIEAAGLDLSRITFSSDGQGSLPDFDSEGNLQGLRVGQVSSLYRQLRNIIQNSGYELEDVLQLITSNPARILGLFSHKGRLLSGYDADIVMLDPETLEITDVIARGSVMMRGGELVRSGTFS